MADCVKIQNIELCTEETKESLHVVGCKEIVIEDSYQWLGTRDEELTI